MKCSNSILLFSLKPLLQGVRHTLTPPTHHKKKRWCSTVTMCLNFLPLRNCHDATITVTRGKSNAAVREAKNDREQAGRFKMFLILDLQQPKDPEFCFSQGRCKTYFRNEDLMNAEVNKKNTPILDAYHSTPPSYFSENAFVFGLTAGLCVL